MKIEIKLREDLPDNCKLVDVEDEQGIKALKDGDDVISYQFEKSKWTQEAANKWVKIKTEVRQPVTKSFTSEYKNFDDDKMTFDAVASTDAVDRDGDILRASGWKLDNFKKNPVLLWGHDAHSLPIGKALNIRKEDGKLLFTPQFAPMSALGWQVYQMFKAGYLNAFSVRFDPFEWKDREKTDDAKPSDRFGREYTKLELLEISVVTIPANAQALVSRDFQNFVVKGMQMENIDLVNDPIIKEQILKGDIEKATYNCECIKCGYKMTVPEGKHCKDIPCPKCGGTMRRAERPGQGQEGLENGEEKSGRVLSAKNRGIISTAITALNELLDATQEEPKEIDSDGELKILQDDLNSLKKDDDVERLLHNAEGVFNSVRNEGGK